MQPYVLSGDQLFVDAWACVIGHFLKGSYEDSYDWIVVQMSCSTLHLLTLNLLFGKGMLDCVTGVSHQSL
jgi:hypothetical protein